MKLPGLFRRSNTGVYYYQPPQVRGVRPPAISLETKSEEIAVQKYHATVADSQRLFAGGSVRMEAAAFLLERRRHGAHTARTSEESERTLVRFAEQVRNRPLASIGHDDVRAFQAAMVGRGLSPATVRSEMGRLSAFFTWAVREGRIERSPCAGIHYPRTIATRAERYCTREERDRLVATAPVDRPDLACCLWLGFFAGLRKAEILEARRDWIDLGGGVLHVRNTPTFVTKDKRDRVIRLSPRLAQFLAGYLAAVEVPPGAHLIRPEIGERPRKWRYRFDPKKSFRAHVADQGLEWVTFHTMRHTFATLHALAGTPLTTIARELGDDVEVTYRHYVGYSRHGGHESATD